MARIVQPGGRVVTLDLSKPESPLFGWLYNVYSRRVMPAIGGLVHGKREPYEYLPTSIARCHSREELSLIMEKVGLTEIKLCNLTCGIVAVHIGTKG
jgi:demethylmenaquinone methyltransferase/2-methoxy-6-polyprenyl-1,4-benzoquinol methylase